MVARVVRRTVPIVLTSLLFAGCGRQVSRNPSGDRDLLATGPGSGYRSVPQPFLAPSIEAVGGLAAWTQCRRLDFDAIVTAHHPQGGVYLTEHQFTLYPWADAIRVATTEPRAALTWQVIGGRFSYEGDLDLDVSPLRDSYPAYAEAVLQIVTAPVRMLEDSVELTRRPVPVQIVGQWYQPVDARFRPQETTPSRRDRRPAGLVEPYWTQGTYSQNYAGALVDLIWLSNPLTRTSLLVRGYDYTKVPEGVLIPTKIEIYHSDPEAGFGPRLAQLDLMP